MQLFPKRFIADRGYDKYKVYDFLDTKRIKPIIKTQKHAVINKKASPTYKARDRAVQSLKDEVEKEKWKQETGYSKRSQVETAFYRYKRILEKNYLRENQKVEVQLNCLILNTMLSLKRPQSKTNYVEEIENNQQVRNKCFFWA